jgi:hypothetical protein
MVAQLSFGLGSPAPGGWDMGAIRGLSLTRPWPFAFVNKGVGTEPKLVENRSWRPPHFIIGNYLALHAAKSWDEDDREWIEHVTGLFVPRNRDSPHSQIFAVCRVIDYVEDLHDPRLSVSRRVWFFGEFGWLLDDLVELVEPVPCTGGLGLWTFDKRQAELHALRLSYQQSIALRATQGQDTGGVQGE